MAESAGEVGEGPTLRLATLDDVPAIEALIRRSVLELQAPDYSETQRAGALGTVFGVDRQLILDGSYFVVLDGAEIVGCGGWSRRRTLFGADAIAGKDDAALDTARDAARIRAFFVAPERARQGIGSRVLAACEQAALAYGFTRLELAATLTGEHLYRRHGYVAVERTATPLPNGLDLPLVRMAKTPARG